MGQTLPVEQHLQDIRAKIIHLLTLDPLGQGLLVHLHHHSIGLKLLQLLEGNQEIPEQIELLHVDMKFKKPMNCCFV